MRAWRAAERTARKRHGAPRWLSSSKTVYSAKANSTTTELLHGPADQIDEVSTQGWVRSVRKQKKVSFAAVSDGSTTSTLQAVLTPADAANLSVGTAVRLQGAWVASRGQGQGHELQVSTVDIQGENDAEHNPLQPKYQTPEFLRTIPHLRARTPANTLLLRLRSHLISGLTTFFDSRGFVQTHTPIITSSDCEGAGEVFSIAPNDPAATRTPEEASQTPTEHFFRSPKYLTVSAQLHLEALAHAVDKVWTLSPTFRAEKSDTPRHLSEFYMLEAEMCFADDLEQIMTLVEDAVRAAAAHASQTRAVDELMSLDRGPHAVDHDTLRKRWDGVAAPAWPRISYADAVALLQRDTAASAFEVPPPSSDPTAGLHAEHERHIARVVGAGRPVFVTHYPSAQKPFYMRAAQPGTAACFDLLVPELCELAGGSLREHGAAALEAAMRAKGVAGANLEWYGDLRRYGSVPHGGFGLGFDRLLCYLSGVSSVRDVVTFPRWYGRCDC